MKRKFAALLPLLLLALTGADDPHPAGLVGQYDGSQTEMAAALELLPDGHFRYELAYGALDEEAAGTWRADGRSVILHSDPVTPPRFSFVGQKAAPAGQARISLAVPHGMEVQYFDAALIFADGTGADGQLKEEGLLLAVEPKQRPTTVRFRLGVFDLISDPIAIDPAKGLDMSFRFEPNDLGHVDFKDAALPIADGQLVLKRFDREIHFRRAQPEKAERQQ
jgi:hypothetical protein